MQAWSRAKASGSAASRADPAAGDVGQPDDGQVAGGVHGGDGRAGDAVLPGVDLEQAGAVRCGRGDEQHVGGGSVEHVVRLAAQLPVAADGAGVVSEFGGVPVAGRGGPGEGGDRGAVGDRGEQPLAGRLVAGGEHGLGGEDDGAEHGGGREVPAQFLHDDAGLGQPGARRRRTARGSRVRRRRFRRTAVARPTPGGVGLRDQPAYRVTQVALLDGQAHRGASRPATGDVASAARTRWRCQAWLPQAGASARTLVSHRLRSCSAVYPIAPCTWSAARAASAAASAQATLAAETSRGAVAASP